MHANVTTWRIDEAIREGDGYDRFLRESAPQIVPILRRHGLVSAYAIRAGADTAVTINLYESAEQAEAALQAAGGMLREVPADKLEPTERQTGRVDDLQQLADG